MIKTIFFDVDGTLLDFKKAEYNALAGLREFMMTHMPQEEFNKLYHAVNDRLWLELEQGKITGEKLKIERFRRFAEELGSGSDPAALSDFYIRALGEGAYYLENAEELLLSLKGRYRMAIITNGLTDVQEARFRILGFNEIFEAILISEKEGTAKPGTGIFKNAAQKMGIRLDKTVLMVGDSLTSDIAGGINAGIRTCWYNPGRWENHSPWKGDYEINDLMELPAVLNQVQEIDKLSR